MIHVFDQALQLRAAVAVFRRLGGELGADPGRAAQLGGDPLGLGQRLPHQAAAPQGQPPAEPGVLGDGGTDAVDDEGPVLAPLEREGEILPRAAPYLGKVQHVGRGDMPFAQAGIGDHLDHVGGEWPDLTDVAGAGDHAFGEKESGGQFAVAAGRAHGDGNALAAGADFQRVFHREPVGARAAPAVLDGDRRGFQSGVHSFSRRTCAL